MCILSCLKHPLPSTDPKQNFNIFEKVWKLDLDGQFLVKYSFLVANGHYFCYHIDRASYSEQFDTKFLKISWKLETHRCGSHKPAGWWWSDRPQRGGRTDRRTDTGGHVGHFSPCGYPMNLHTKNRCHGWNRLRSKNPGGFGRTDWRTDGRTRVVMRVIFHIYSW